MKKQCNVVMLPTEKASDLYYHNPTEVLRYKGHQSELEGIVNKQHLYLTSDEEIEEGDCIINQNTNSIAKYTGHGSMDWWKKIIATTDKSLRCADNEFFQVPQIPESFIKAYIEAQGNIKEVLVEYMKGVTIVDEKQWENNQLFIKTRNDNTVIIHRAKSITKDEMYLNMQYYMEYCKLKEYVTPQEWIEKHKHF